MVGEAGPEAIVPLDRAGGFGGTTIHIYELNVAGLDPDAIAEALQEKLEAMVNTT